MILYFLRSSTYQNMILPVKPIGRYFVQTQISGMSKDVLVVQGDGEKWFLYSTTEAEILDSERNSTGKANLLPGNLIPVKIRATKSTAFLFVEKLSDSHRIFNKVTIKGDAVIRIGRQSDNDIVCNNPFVSGQHAQLHYVQGRWTVIDTKSSNGVFVNGQRVREQILNAGDVIFIMGIKLIPIGQTIAFNNPNGVVRIASSQLFGYQPGALRKNASSQLIDLREGSYFSIKPRVLEAYESNIIQVEAPPPKHDEDDTPAILVMGPSITMGMSSAMTGLVAVSSAVASGNPSAALPSIVMSGAMLAGSLLWPQLNRKYTKEKIRRQEEKRQEIYRKYLGEIEQKIQQLMTEQKDRLLKDYLSGADLAKQALKDEKILWQRKKTDADFLSLRIGSGNRKVRCTLAFPQNGLVLQEDNLLDELNRLKKKNLEMQQVPLVWQLANLSFVGVTGGTVDVTAFAHSMVLQLAIQHSYEDVKICLVYSEKQREIYEAYRWLPHVWSDDRKIRFIASGNEEAEILSMYFSSIAESNKATRESKQKNDTHYVFVLLDKHLADLNKFCDLIAEPENKNFHAICCYRTDRDLPKWTQSYVELHEGKGVLSWTDGQLHEDGIRQTFSTDSSVNVTLKNNICLKLATLQLKLSTEQVNLPDSCSFLDLFQVSDISHINLLSRWQESNPIKTLRAPIGIAESGELSYLDVHQKAHGPHGLIAGMTGSGKSEFIITYLLSMAVCYAPHEVAFVLIDYKGGGMAKALEYLPHTVGVITNLDGNNIHRSLVAIESELKRRQQIFEDARVATGSTNIDIYVYQQMYRAGKVQDPLPHLLLVSDEFAELKVQQPDFMDSLISAARIGRSLGVHLILATQKPAGVVNDQIWSNSRFRVCLKVQDASDSNDMIKRPDAASLTTIGRYYMQVGYNEVFVLGQGAYSGAVYTPFLPYAGIKECAIDVVDEVGNTQCRQIMKIKNPNPNVENQKQLDVVTSFIAQTARSISYKKRELWQPPLEEVITLATLREKYSVTSKPYILDPIIGEIDDPYTQSRRLLTCPVSDGKNIVLYGGVGSGKFQFLQTMLFDLIQDHSYEEVRLFLLDFADDGLSMFASAPQVGAIILQNEENRIRSLFRLLREEINNRKPLIAEFVSEKSMSGKLSKANLPVMLIVVHHWAVFQENYEDMLSDDVLYCLREGPRYGIQFVATGITNNFISYRYQQYFALKYVLQMNQDDDYSAILGRVGKLYPAKNKGRGLIMEDRPYEFQTAEVKDDIDLFCRELPRPEGIATNQEIPVMPERVSAEVLASDLDEAHPMQVPIGMDAERLVPVNWSLDCEPVQLLVGSHEDVDNFLNELLSLLKHRQEPEIVVLDASECTSLVNQENACVLSEAAQWKEYSKQLFKDCIENNRLLKTGELNKPHEVLIILGVDNLLSALSDQNDMISLAEMQDIPGGTEEANKKYTYAYWLKFLIERLKSEWRQIVILSDDSKSLQKYSLDSWYRKQVSGKNGLLIGSFNEQYQFLLDGVPPWKKLEAPYGYLIKDGHETELKFLSYDSQKENKS